MDFQFNDGGRQAAGYRGETGDCVIRAVAIATQQPYQTVYEALGAGCREERRSKYSRTRKASARDGVHTSRKWFKDYMVGLGWHWTPTMAIGSGCTVHLKATELPSGRLVVAVSKHYTAVIDGVIHDTHNPADRGSIGVPQPDGTWQWKKAERCVYGYWSQ